MIVLIGFMGAGKSTVGKLLARRLDLLFRDADKTIEVEQGRSIPEIFAADGEDAFRRIETETITRLLSEGEGVLALGGGALGSAQVRQALAGHDVVWLDIAYTEALRRVGGDDGRPMLSRTDLPELYAQRQAAYREAATVRVPTGGGHPRRVVAEVARALQLD